MAPAHKSGLYAFGTLRGIRQRTIKTGEDGGSFVQHTAVLDRGDGYDLFVSQNGEGGVKMKAALEGLVGKDVELLVYAGNYKEIRFLELVSVVE
jgi:hypothetical protein